MNGGDTVGARLPRIPYGLSAWFAEEARLVRIRAGEAIARGEKPGGAGDDCAVREAVASLNRWEVQKHKCRTAHSDAITAADDYSVSARIGELNAA